SAIRVEEHGAMELMMYLKRTKGAFLQGSPQRLMIAAIAVSLFSLDALAEQIGTPAPSRQSTSLLLRKRPPEEVSPGARWASRAARETFPEIFERVFEGSAVVRLVFAHDGRVLKAEKQMFPPGVAPSGFDSIAMAVEMGAD